MKLITSTLIALFAIVGTLHAERGFFVFDNGLTDIKSPDDQAALLKKLGYDGICTRPQKATPEFFTAMDRHGIKVVASYVTLAAEGDAQEIPREIKHHLRKLKERGTIVWLTVANEDASDQAALAMIRKVCDLAAGHGLEVVLYPHVGYKTNTATDKPVPARSDKQDFIEAIINGSEVMIDAEAGHRVNSQCLLGLAAIKAGKPLDWDPVAEKITNHPGAAAHMTGTYRDPWDFRKMI